MLALFLQVLLVQMHCPLLQVLIHLTGVEQSLPIEIESDGSTGDVIWDASCKLTGGPCKSMSGDSVAATNSPSSRNIFTYVNGSKQQFTSSLSASAKIRYP